MKIHIIWALFAYRRYSYLGFVAYWLFCSPIFPLDQDKWVFLHPPALADPLIEFFLLRDGDDAGIIKLWVGGDIIEVIDELFGGIIFELMDL